MTRQRSIAGLGVLAALIAGCVTAPGAVAVPGTTAFTCENVGKGKGSFTKEHCASADGGTGEYGQVAVKEKTPTVLTARNHETDGTFGPWKLKSAIGESVLELEIGEAAVAGTIENKVVGLEHTAVGLGRLYFRNVTVLSPAGCVVNLDKQPGVGVEGEIESNLLLYSTALQGDALKFSRPFGEGEVLATFYLQKCKNEAFLGTYKLNGTFTTTSIDGATAKFTLANTTAQKTLKLGTVAAGFEGELTSESRDPNGAIYTPLTFTTVGP